jgi:beta-glucosidase
LIGKANPGGKLPAAFPRASGAVPSPYAHLPTGRPADADLAKDTARYRDLPITPLFPFGHGLSYTRFDYGPLTLGSRDVPADGSLTVAVDVRNGGKRAGDEVVQLYVRDPVASVSRPVQELRGFRRIQLEPGETKRVRFTLRPAQLAFWDAGVWRIEAGRIELMVGSSSSDIRARGEFRITSNGTSAVPAAAIATVTAEEALR